MPNCLGRLLFSVGLLACSQGLITNDACAAEHEVCQSASRIESARELLAEGKDFRLNASQSSVNMQDAIRKARGLNEQARKLQASQADLDQYNRDLKAFKAHVDAYRAHMQQVGRDLGHCRASEKAYAEHVRKYSLHTDQFHMPNVPPPHICEELQLSEEENAKMANQLRNDRDRLARAEAELAQSEARLNDKVAENDHADRALLNRSRLAEEEKKLSSEFAALKTELELLNTQHGVLRGKTPTASGGIGQVKGQVKDQVKGSIKDPAQNNVQGK